MTLYIYSRYIAHEYVCLSRLSKMTDRWRDWCRKKMLIFLWKWNCHYVAKVFRTRTHTHTIYLPLYKMCFSFFSFRKLLHTIYVYLPTKCVFLFSFHSSILNIVISIKFPSQKPLKMSNFQIRKINQGDSLCPDMENLAGSGNWNMWLCFLWTKCTFLQVRLREGDEKDLGVKPVMLLVFTDKCSAVVQNRFWLISVMAYFQIAIAIIYVSKTYWSI